MPSITTQLSPPINHAFFDSPVGKHGAPQVRSLPPNDRRTSAERVGGGIYKALNRVFNALAPKGRRTDVEYRDSLKRTSREVGALFGTIIHGKTAAGTLDKTFARIKHTAEPVTRRGVGFSELLEKRFEVHLSRLTDHELKTLWTQLTVLRATTDDTDVSAHLNLLHTKLCREAEHRVFAAGPAELLPLLKKAIQEVKEKPALAADTFDRLGGCTKAIMTRCGLSLEAKHEDETLLAQAVIRTVFNKLLMSGQVTAVELKALLATLPSDRLADLQPSPNAHLAIQDTIALELLVEDVAQQRERAALDGLNKAVAASNDTLPKGAAPVSADALRHLIDVHTQWEALKKHHKAFDVPVNPDTVGKLNALRTRLSQLTIDASSLKPLKDHELSSLAKALEVLPLPDGKERIAQAMTMRLEESTQKVGEALRGAIGLLASEAAGQALQALAKLESVVSKAKARSDALQGLNQAGGDDARSFEFATYGPVFKSMDADQLKTCLRTLSRPFTLRLMETLKAMALELHSAIDGRQDDPSHPTVERLMAMGQVLLGLLGEAGEETARRTNPDNPTRYEAPDVGMSLQDPAIRDAVRQLFPIPK